MKRRRKIGKTEYKVGIGDELNHPACMHASNIEDAFKLAHSIARAMAENLGLDPDDMEVYNYFGMEGVQCAGVCAHNEKKELWPTIIRCNKLTRV